MLSLILISHRHPLERNLTLKVLRSMNFLCQWRRHAQSVTTWMETWRLHILFSKNPVMKCKNSFLTVWDNGTVLSIWSFSVLDGVDAKDSRWGRLLSVVTPFAALWLSIHCITANTSSMILEEPHRWTISVSFYLKNSTSSIEEYAISFQFFKF